MFAEEDTDGLDLSHIVGEMAQLSLDIQADADAEVEAAAAEHAAAPTKTLPLEQCSTNWT